MNESIIKKLEKGEEILWSGKPIKTTFLDEDVKKKYILELIITAAVCIFMVVGYILLCQKNNAEIKPILLAVVILLCILPVSSIFSVWRSLGSATYFVTNQRAIIYRGGDNILALDLRMVDSVSIVRGKNGMDSLCIGSPACKISTSRLRTAGIDSVRKSSDDGVTLTYPVFYNIADAVEAKRVLESPLN